MTRTAGAQIGCQRPSRFWGLGCPKIYHEAEDTLALILKKLYPYLKYNPAASGDFGKQFFQQGMEYIDQPFFAHV
ncbi:hypothetical protein, partial [Thiolapillus sp.]